MSKTGYISNPITPIENMEPAAKKPRLEEKKLTLTRFDFKSEDTVRPMTEYPDSWMDMRSITEDQFEQFGITTCEWFKSYCQGNILLMADNRWTAYEIGHILPSKQWFHMGLNDHVQTLMMEADTGLAKLFCIYEGHNIKTIDDNGSGYYWNESLLLWEELGKNKLRKRIGDFFEVLFSEQVQWAHHNLDHIRMIRNTFDGEGGEVEQQHEGYAANQRWEKQFVKNLESFENEYEQTCKILKQIGSWNGLGGIFQMICADAYDKEFEDVVNMSSTELPTKGGNVIDFRTLQVRPRCHSDYWSYELNTEYTPIPSVMPTSEIDIQRVEERSFVVGMLKTFCNDDIEMLNYLQRLTGVMCTREGMIMKKIFIFVGKTDTGKSETFKWIRNVLIDQRNYVTIGEEVLMQTGRQQKGRCTTELMNMPRARACVASELSPNCVFNNTLVKRLTGGDPQTIRGLRKAETQFILKAVLALFTNDAPQLSLLEEAMNRRVVVIPCEGKIVKNEENNQKCIRMPNLVFRHSYCLLQKQLLESDPMNDFLRIN